MTKKTSLKRIFISCSIVFCIALAIVFTAPLFIQENLIKQAVTKALENSFETSCQTGTVSFHWPNRINIAYLIIQRQGQSKESPIQVGDFQGTVKLLSLFSKKIVVKKISIRDINYENQFLVKDLVTDKFLFENGILSTNARFTLNDGPATLKGTADIRQKKPVFNFSFDAKDIHITQDVPALRLLPVLAEKGGEIGGILNLQGNVSGSGLGREIMNSTLAANVKLTIRDGYIRGNKIISAIMEIIGVKDAYSFQSMKTEIQIKDGKVYTPKMDMEGQVMDLHVSGVAEFEGSISYDAVVKFHDKQLSKGVEKIARLILKDNELPLEIRGTTKDPIISVKLPRDNLENLIHGLVNDFLPASPKKRKKSTNEK